MKANVNNSTINNEIENIFRILKIQASDDTVVVKERAPKGSSSCGMISVLSRSDLRREKADSSCKAVPSVRYVFYPHTCFPTRLGSVAIYGKDAVALCSRLRSQRTLFGLTVIDAVVEYGRRPYVDVRLRA